MPPDRNNKLVLNVSYTNQYKTVSIQPCMIVFVCVSHADGEHEGGVCELLKPFDDCAFPLEPVSVVFLPS